MSACANRMEWLEHIAALRRDYETLIADCCDTDTAVRASAKRVLTEYEVDGDSYFTPSIEVIVEALVGKIEELQKP